MDEPFISLSRIRQELDSAGFRGRVIDKAPRGRNSVTLFLRESPEQPIERVIQIPHPEVAYQATKKAAIYNSVGEHTNIPVPRARLLSLFGRACLDMDYRPGQPLSDSPPLGGAARRRLIQDVGSIIAELHTRVPAGDVFGWLDGDGVREAHRTFGDYARSESERIRRSLTARLGRQRLQRLEAYVWPRAALLYEFESVPVVVWYDIHGDNVLVSDAVEEPRLSGWLDPGAARIGAPEWDIAHACEHLCETPEEELLLLQSYCSHTGRSVDEGVLASFRALIALDDLALALSVGQEQMLERCSMRLEELSRTRP